MFKAANEGSKGVVSEPDQFDGKVENYHWFKCQYSMYIMDRAGKFSNNAKKVTFILSYMKEGLAGLWADNKADEL